MHTLTVATSGLCIFGLSLPADFRSKQLRFRAWMPYDYSSQFSFKLTYACQFVTVMLAAVANLTSENLFSGLMIHTLGQFEILELRLQNIKRNESHLARRCAHHHKQIYKLVSQQEFE